MIKIRRRFGERLRHHIMETTADGSKLFWHLTISYVVMTTIFKFVEKQSWLDSFYFVFVTGQTVGYGDFSPKTELGKVLTMVFIVWSFLLWTMVIAWVIDNLRREDDKWSHDEQERLEASQVRIEQELETMPPCWTELPPLNTERGAHAPNCSCVSAATGWPQG